jgi:hypothetical protein
MQLDKKGNGTLCNKWCNKKSHALQHAAVKYHQIDKDAKECLKHFGGRYIRSEEIKDDTTPTFGNCFKQT